MWLPSKAPSISTPKRVSASIFNQRQTAWQRHGGQAGVDAKFHCFTGKGPERFARQVIGFAKPEKDSPVDAGSAG
jgi:hypothetical protein